MDVWPTGFAQNLTEGILRASFRASTTGEPAPITPGKVYADKIDLWSTSNVFLKGHRIRVEVSSSNFPRFERNLNTGKRGAQETQFVKATNTILDGGAHSSALILPWWRVGSLSTRYPLRVSPEKRKHFMREKRDKPPDQPFHTRKKLSEKRDKRDKAKLSDAYTPPSSPIGLPGGAATIGADLNPSGSFTKAAVRRLSSFPWASSGKEAAIDCSFAEIPDQRRRRTAHSHLAETAPRGFVL